MGRSLLRGGRDDDSNSCYCERNSDLGSEDSDGRRILSVHKDKIDQFQDSRPLRLRPDFLAEILHVLDEQLRLLPRRKVASFIVVSAPDKVPGLQTRVSKLNFLRVNSQSHLRDQLRRHRCQFPRMPRIAHRFLHVPLRLGMEESGFCAEELAVRVDCAREAGREPVESCGVEDFVDWRCFVGPLLELLADPARK